ncbi:Hypothetical protein CINCED_3A023986 [Cinara cedri]|uniref:Uncharacterized protein n=1 Tax=Cinara cedri TaxID=506608 RepID=A0A5E4NI98_9HEMI|nr:Hypothetical protein CINCED_3A023986 [Cinara cedri]
MEISTTKDAAMNEKSDWRKEDGVDLKYHRKTNGNGQFKRNFNVLKESKSKYEVCGCSNHV